MFPRATAMYSSSTSLYKDVFEPCENAEKIKCAEHRLSDLDTTSPFASSTSTGEIVTQTFSSKMNDEPVPALDQGFEGMRDSFDNNAPF